MLSEYIFIILCTSPQHRLAGLTVALIFELTQEGLVFKYFGPVGAILNAANGAVIIQDQRYWIHFNVFAVRPSNGLA